MRSRMLLCRSRGTTPLSGILPSSVIIRSGVAGAWIHTAPIVEAPRKASAAGTGAGSATSTGRKRAVKSSLSVDRLREVERAPSRSVQFRTSGPRSGSSSGGTSNGSSTVGLSEAERRRLPLWIRKRPQRIYMIRHGESMGNVDEAAYGRIPDHKIPLTARGMEQAHAAGQTLHRLIGDETTEFYLSPYQRTRQTYSEIVKSFNPRQYKMYEEPRLREQDFGNLQDRESMKRCHAEREKFGSFFYRFPEGESGADVYDRVSGFMETMHRRFSMMSANDISNVVLISHGLTIRLFLMRYFHWQVEFSQKLWNMENCQIVTMDRQSDGRYLLSTPLRLNPDGALWMPPESMKAMDKNPGLRNLYTLNEPLFAASRHGNAHSADPVDTAAGFQSDADTNSTLPAPKA